MPRQKTEAELIAELTGQMPPSTEDENGKRTVYSWKVPPFFHGEKWYHLATIESPDEKTRIAIVTDASTIADSTEIAVYLNPHSGEIQEIGSPTEFGRLRNVLETLDAMRKGNKHS